MTEKSGNSRTFEKKMVKILSSFAVLLAIAIFFGYSAGKDMALRENARDIAFTDQ